MPHLFQPFLVWEGPYLDTWSIAHFTAGFLIAYALSFWETGRWKGFFVVAIAASLWEGFEQLIGTRMLETPANSVLDIVCALAGYLAGYEVFRSRLIPHDKNSIAACAAAIFLIVCALRVLGA